jgi:outer membrane protein OmpA-like peptidoglycan-associated protein
MKSKKKMGCIAVTALFVAIGAQGALKDETMAPLDAAAKTSQGTGLSASINGSTIGTAMRIGDEIKFHIDVEEDAYITIVYVDSQGVIDIIDPDFGEGSNFLTAGQSVIYPAEDSGVILTLEPPLGRDAVYIFGTKNRLKAGDFMPAIAMAQNPATVTTGEPQLFDMEDSIKVASAFVGALGATNAPDEYAVALLESTVQGRGEGAEYESEDIVAFFSARKYRSISKPKLDANILFHTNSAELTDQAKVNLDEWGKSLVHPTLAESTFQIGGHTDDVGESRYNLDLSLERAEAVKSYLAAQFDIDEDRLEVKAYGEDQPVIENVDEEARQRNRRVEFQRISAN